MSAPAQQPPSSRGTGRRKSSPNVDIIADIFEAMHDLHFLRTPHEGAEFVLALAMDKMQSQLGIVQLYDINHREFVVASAAGPNGQRLVGSRTAERDPLLVEIMTRHAPVMVDARADARVQAGRWKALGGSPSWILACSVAQGGRFLGTIEIGMKGDGRFRQADVDGLMYIAQSFSEFVAQRGLVFGDESDAKRR